jgi:hypothetical protein
LIAHCRLVSAARDAVDALHCTANNIDWDGQDRPTMRFNGRDSVIRIHDAASLHLGDQDLSLALWVKCSIPLRNTLGDLVSKLDPDRQRGWNFHIAGNSAMGYATADTLW